MKKMSASKRKQDEKHTKMLRELGSQPYNKQCFDCHQRGPTYVNMTIGSFVCTGCSGLLRGLNPPHRVKSISMASFTPDEIDFVKNRGNEYCKKVWLGLYDGDTRTFDGFRDDQQMKDFLILDSPSHSRQQHQQQSVASSNGTKSQLLSSPSTSISRQKNNIVNTHSTTNASLISTGSPTQSAVSQASRPPMSALGSGTKSLDLLDGDPFSSPVLPNSHSTAATNHQQSMSMSSSSSGGGNFANFANFDAFATSAPLPQPQPAAPHPVSAGVSRLLPPPPGQDSGMIMPKSATVPASLTTGSNTRNSIKQPAAPAQDKYSALAELDGLFSTAGSSIGELNSSWTAGTSTTSAFGGGGPAFGEVNDSFSNSFGGTSGSMGNIPKSGPAFVSSSTSAFGANSNPFFSGTSGIQSQPPQIAMHAQAQTTLATQRPAFGVMGGGGWSQAQPTPASGAANPFFAGGGSMMTNQPSVMPAGQFQQGASNPFGGLTPIPVSQQQQQQIGPIPVSGGFGGVGITSNQQMMAPASMWGQPAGGFPPQQAQMAGGWQQNPFMAGQQQMGIAAQQQQQVGNWNPFL